MLALTTLNELLECVKCRVCGGSVNIVKDDLEFGIAVKLWLNCEICGQLKTTWSSPRVGTNTACKPFEINVLAARAYASTGNGQTALNDIFSTLNISWRGMHCKTYQDYLKDKLNPAAQNAAYQVMNECANAVKLAYRNLNFGHPANIAVSFDGAWLTRGHLSHVCVGTVIKFFTGYVLDFVVLSNFCLGCHCGPKEGVITFSLLFRRSGASRFPRNKYGAHVQDQSVRNPPNVHVFTSFRRLAWPKTTQPSQVATRSIDEPDRHSTSSGVMPVVGKLDSFDPSTSEWAEYRERAELYFTANDIPSDKRSAVFLTCCGPETYSLLRGLLAPSKPAQTGLTEIFATLRKHYAPRVSEVVASFKFFSRHRKGGDRK